MSEAGNAKNVANFGSYVSISTGHGAVYNPTSGLIKLNSLNDKLVESQGAMSNVALKNSEETLALNARFALFEPLEQLVTRIVSAADVDIADALFSADLRTIARKLQGRRVSKLIADDPLTPDIDESKLSISASQMSYDSRLANFAELITLLKTQNGYAPNETELQIASLETLLAEMQAANTNAVNKINAAKAARIERDQILYNSTEGIIVRAALIKKYIKSLFGANSPQYKQLTAIKFKKP